MHLDANYHLLDPYQHSPMSEVRAAIVNAIEERIGGMERVPRCRAGLELHLVVSRRFAFDTGERIPAPVALAEGLQMDRPSIGSRAITHRSYPDRRRRGGGG